MNSALRLSVIIFYLAITATACSRDKSSVPSMTCNIVSTSDKCTSVPTLSKGRLKMMQGGRFVLDGQYSACFHEENVIIQGKYQRSNYSNGMSIELLATKIKGLKSSTFPSTIAVINLDKSSLKGLINDVWARIRSPMQSGDKPVVEITCKTD